MESNQSSAWSLTDEEWCEICFMLVELGTAQQQLQALLLADNRPTLNQLWISASAYQRTSQTLFDYLAQQLRSRALDSERRNAA
ncbi:MAG TPA: hypothetical protein VFZ66_16790 [Herpetosiphonaceae bacterium]